MTSSAEHTGHPPASQGAVEAAAIEADLIAVLKTKAGAPVAPDVDLFASGTISSLFAMELVVRLEQSYGVAIVGPDLAMDNFRTVQSMTELVVRLKGAPAGMPGG
jgi:methoxymalonate biosynthesis acyl carrier protein